MKRHKITRKKKTLKKYSKAQFRRLNKQTNLTIKMKGGDNEYIKHRRAQLERTKEIISELENGKHNTLRDQIRLRIGTLKYALKYHIDSVSVSDVDIWHDHVKNIDPVINDINGFLAKGSGISPIPVSTNTQSSYSNKSTNDTNDENDRNPISISQRSAKKSIGSIGSIRNTIKKKSASIRSINSRGRGL
jgi:hypothetical protein